MVHGDITKKTYMVYIFWYYEKKYSLEAQQDQLCEEFVFVPWSVWSENLLGSKPAVGLQDF